MSRINNVIVLKSMQTPIMMECPDCDGRGEYEEDDPRPHAHGFNGGFVDTEWVECPTCSGDGEIERPCCGCGEVLTVWDGEGQAYCRECRAEPDPS